MPIHHPRKVAGKLEVLRSRTFAAFGQTPGADFIVGVLTASKQPKQPIVGIPLFHPAQGMWEYGVPFWVIQFVVDDRYDVGDKYTLSVRDATEFETAKNWKKLPELEKVEGIEFELMKHSTKITYPLAGDSTTTVFVAYGTASPGGSPTGTMEQVGGSPHQGTNPISGTNWGLHFNVPAGSGYGLGVAVTGSGNDSVQASPGIRVVNGP
jgi:hypothetical protein